MRSDRPASRWALSVRLIPAATLCLLATPGLFAADPAPPATAVPTTLVDRERGE
ncbi:MAG: hypothetical protein H6Q01_916, partial [Acidobacteria bacterium]|nr:hypothetical protein [Acidobacteriota bacterium]